MSRMGLRCKEPEKMNMTDKQTTKKEDNLQAKEEYLKLNEYLG